MLQIRRFLAWMAINLVTGLATITLAIWRSGLRDYGCGKIDPIEVKP